MNSESLACGSGSGCSRTWWLAGISCVLALVGTLGSLYLSLGMGLKACPLCFYQRCFMMIVLVIMGLGMYVDRSRPGLLGLLSVPVAWAGLGVAGFHEYLVLKGMLECPLALLGMGTAPAQSLMVFSILTCSVTATAWLGRGEACRQSKVAVAIGVVIGLAMAWACIASSPPLPPVPTSAYDPVKQPLDMCRPPFREVISPGP